MKAVAFGPTSCSSVLVPKSKLLHRPETQYGFVPKHSHHGGKNLALRAEKPIFSTKTITKTNTIVSSRGQELFFSEAMFFPLMLSAFRHANPLMARSVCESLLSGTKERGSNEGRRPQIAAEGFLRFLLSLRLRLRLKIKVFLCFLLQNFTPGVVNFVTTQSRPYKDFCTFTIFAAPKFG